MSVERPFVWLLGLLATALAVAVYLTPGVAPPADLVLAGLVAVVALPFVAVYAPLVFDRGRRGWR